MGMTLDHLKKNLKVTTIDQAFQQLQNPAAMQIFNTTLQTRRDGYRPYYPSDFIAADSSDWIDRHYLLTIEEQKHSRPLGCFRISTLSRNEQNRLAFPLIDAVQHANIPLHREALEIIISRAKAAHQEVQYLSWVTMHPEFRQNKECSRFLQELVVAFGAHEVKTHQSIFLVASVIQFKTYRWMEASGYHRLNLAGQTLPAVKNPNSGFDVDLMVQTDLSRWAEDCWMQHQPLIQNLARFEIADNPALKFAA